MLKLIGNLIWLLCGGLWAASAWLVMGLLACLTIIGIPVGIAAIRIAGFTLWPFGRRVEKIPDAGPLPFIGNLLWAVLCGWELALAHLAAALVCAITIIGIPFAWQHLKLAGLSFTPYGRRIVASTR